MSIKYIKTNNKYIIVNGSVLSANLATPLSYTDQQLKDAVVFGGSNGRGTATITQLPNGVITTSPVSGFSNDDTVTINFLPNHGYTSVVTTTTKVVSGLPDVQPNTFTGTLSDAYFDDVVTQVLGITSGNKVATEVQSALEIATPVVPESSLTFFKTTPGIHRPAIWDMVYSFIYDYPNFESIPQEVTTQFVEMYSQLVTQEYVESLKSDPELTDTISQIITAAEQAIANGETVVSLIIIALFYAMFILWITVDGVASGDHNILTPEEEKIIDILSVLSGLENKETYFAIIDFLNGTGTEKLLTNFGQQELLTSINMPDVTEVGYGAFMMSPITSIVAPSLITIHPMAFASSNSLSELNIPNVETIGDYAFSTSTISTLTLSNVVHIKSYAFASWSNLIELNAPNLLTTGESAFENATISTLDIPSITNIGKKSFARSTIHSFVSDSVVEIGSEAFRYAPISNLVLNNATYIGDHAFNAIADRATITMKSQFNTDNEKSRIFGTSWATKNLVFTWV